MSGKLRTLNFKVIAIILASILASFSLVAVGAPTAEAVGGEVAEIQSQSYCQDVLIVGVAGSGQSGYGREVGAAVRHLSEKISPTHRVREMALDYPAAGIDALLRDITIEVASGNWDYFNSIGDGQVKLVSELGAAASDCPDEKWILIGYSQGAFVINQAAQSLSMYADRILGVLMIADPTRSVFNERQNFGNAAGGFGISIIAPAYAANPYPYSLSEVTVEVCMEADIVCDYMTWHSSLIGPYFGAEIHTNISETLITQAADSFLSRALAPKPSKLPTATSVPRLEAVGPGSVKVSWAPFREAGTSITKYKVLLGTPGTPNYSTAEVGPETGTTTLNGLRGGSTVTAIVEAVTAAGSAKSQPSLPVTIPATVPPTQHNHLAYKGATTESISFRIFPPDHDGGSPITSYRVTTSDLSAPYPYPETQTFITGTLDATIGGLQQGTGYRFVVDACNAVGCAKDAEHRIWYTRPAVPSAPKSVSVANVTENSFELSWEPPASVNPAFSGYVITVLSSAGARTLNTEAAQTRVRVDGLSPDTEYTVSVQGVNFVGPGLASESITLRTLAPAIPSSPATPVAALISPSSVRVTWAAPENNGAQVSGYEVVWTDGSSTQRSRVPAATNEMTLSGLAGDRSYTLTVAAVGSGGTSAPSAPTEAIYVPGEMPATAPAAVPDSIGDGPNDPGLALQELGGDTTKLAIDGLEPGRWYYASRAGSPLGSGWYLSDNAGRITVSTTGTKPGNHSLVLQDKAGELVGSVLYRWTPSSLKAQGGSRS